MGISFLQSFVHGEKVREKFAELRKRHRSAATIKSQVKSKIARQQYKGIADALLVIQSAIRGWLVRRCSGDIAWLSEGVKVLIQLYSYLRYLFVVKNKDHLQWCKSVSKVSYTSSSNM